MDNKYNKFLRRTDLVTNQVERDALREQQAAKARSKRIQQQNAKRFADYQRILQAELEARIFANVTSAGGASGGGFTNTKSILLDGIDDYVSVPNSTSLNIITAMCVSMWFKTTSSSGMYPLTQGSGSEIKYFIQLYAPINRIRLQIWDGSLVPIAVDNTQVFDDGQWHNLTFTTDAITTTNGVKVYFDGNLLSNKGTLNNNGTFNISAGLYIGQIPNTARFNGNIDEVALFNSELSASDITSIYNGGVPNDISSLSPVSWWRCGDGDTSPTLTDNGSGGNDGTMTNFTTFSTDVPE